MGRNFRGVVPLLWNFFRSGWSIFLCSLAFGILLGGGSLVCLEIVASSGDEFSRGGSLSGTAKDVSHGVTAAEQAEAGKPDTAESGRSGADAQRRSEEPEAREPEAERLKLRELEREIRGISTEHRGEYGVVVWRPGSARVKVGDEKKFKSASLAKLPVFLALYREASEGSLSLDERIQMSASDIQPGTGTLQNRPPGTTMTLRECAEYLVKESDNIAWKMLEDRLGEQRIESELARVGTDSTRYEYGHHTTTPNDTLRLLRKISDPAYTSPALSREMISAMTGTDFEDWLPQGLPADARISHKIGILGTSFSDAGIVFPPESTENSEPYYVAALSKDASETEAREAMREISLAAYRSLVDPDARPRSASQASADQAD